jgi:biotin transporter BioY
MEYIFFALLLWYDIKRKFFRTAIITLTSAFLVFLIIYYFKSTLVRLDSVPIGIETFLIFLFIFFFFIEFSNNETPVNFYYHNGFWISVGILIYLGGSFFFYILINHLSNEQVSAFGNLTYLAEIIKNALFVIATIVLKKKLPSNNKKTDTIPFLDTI